MTSFRPELITRIRMRIRSILGRISLRCTTDKETMLKRQPLYVTSSFFTSMPSFFFGKMRYQLPVYFFKSYFASKFVNRKNFKIFEFDLEIFEIFRVQNDKSRLRHEIKLVSLKR